MSQVIERAAALRGRPLVAFAQAMTDPQLFGPWFGGPSWAAQRMIAKAEDGEPLTPDEAVLFMRISGGRRPPSAQVPEVWKFFGRRTGKTIVQAARGAWMGSCIDYRPYLKPGELGVGAILAADREQSAVTFRYLEAFFDHVPLLRQLVKKRTKDSLLLSNGVLLQVLTSSYRLIRGRTLVFAIAEELCFWFDTQESKNPATEVLAALRPAMATIPVARLFVISSPYRRAGIGWETYRRYFGTDDPRVMVLQGATPPLNPTIDPAFLEAEYEKDPSAARAEYGGEWRDDLESFVSPDAVERAVVKGRSAWPFAPGVKHAGGCDPAGGSGGDSMTLGVARMEGDMAVLCRVVEWRPPFSPDAAVASAAAVLKEYGLSRVIGDAYAGDWPKDRFRAHGIRYEKADQTKSDFYQECLPLLNAGRVALLDHPRTVQQLLALERRTSRAGKDSISHPPNGRDDCINAAAIALAVASRRPTPMLFDYPPRASVPTPGEWTREQILRRGEPMGLWPSAWGGWPR